MENKDIDFIARHYQKGLFSTDRGWRRLGIVSIRKWKGLRIAAVVAGVVMLSATAAYLYHDYKEKTEVMEKSITLPVGSPMTEVKVIDFEEAPLTEVVSKIENVYGVRVINLPDNPGDFALSLHYEGNPADLIAVINDILGTNMKVSEK